MGRIHAWPNDQKADEMDISLLSTEPQNCDQCGYEAENMYVLDAHTWEMHDDSIKCNLCDNTFENKRDLMIHKKEDHTEKIELCWHYSKGTCPYGEDKCWFIHEKEVAYSNCSEYICNFCEQICRTQSEFLKHRKTKHSEQVPTCKNFKDGECIYGQENCWFNHKTEKENNYKAKDNENEDNANAMNENKLLSYRV